MDTKKWSSSCTKIALCWTDWYNCEFPDRHELPAHSKTTQKVLKYEECAKNRKEGRNPYYTTRSGHW